MVVITYHVERVSVQNEQPATTETPPLEFQFAVLPEIEKSRTKTEWLWFVFYGLATLAYIYLFDAELSNLLFGGLFLVLLAGQRAWIYRKRRKTAPQVLRISKDRISWHFGSQETLGIRELYIKTIEEDAECLKIRTGGPVLKIDVERDHFTPEDYHEIRRLLAQWKPISRRR